MKKRNTDRIMKVFKTSREIKGAFSSINQNRSNWPLELDSIANPFRVKREEKNLLFKRPQNNISKRKKVIDQQHKLIQAITNQSKQLNRGAQAQNQ